MVERLIDIAAQRLAVDPAELRRRNLLRPEQLPWRTPFGVAMHSVNFPAVLDRALQQSAWTKRADNVRRGTVRQGRGIAFTIEGYDSTYDESVEIVVNCEGRVEIRIGTKSGGQSHETTYTQLAADAFQLPPDAISIVQGDTDLIAHGNGTGASRSLTTGGSAILKTAATLLETARSIAATCLQCKPEDLTYSAGCYVKRGPLPGSIDLAAIAGSMPEHSLQVTDVFRPEQFTFPGGCHIASVEVDLATGKVRLLDYHAVHDPGVAVNPTIVEGQLHGAIVQGVGAALMEHVRFDPMSGQIVTATFQDYAMPHAHDIGPITIGLHGTPCASNLVGAKPVGEAGTVAAPPAVINAIIDAIGMPGIDHIELPATAEQVWRAIEKNRLRSHVAHIAH
jgi:carbon-monoxide dehydrogenase large subunit